MKPSVSVNNAPRSANVGRTAIFEVLAIDDNIRKALMQKPKMDVIRKLARQAGNRTLQEEGILLIARGITTVNELQRVLNPKQ